MTYEDLVKVGMIIQILKFFEFAAFFINTLIFDEIKLTLYLKAISRMDKLLDFERAEYRCIETSS